MFSFGLTQALLEKLELAWLDVPGFTSVALLSVTLALPNRSSLNFTCFHCSDRLVDLPWLVLVR